jgi:hypothetical protein
MDFSGSRAFHLMTGKSGSRSALRVLFEELDGVAHGQYRFGRVVRNFATKFFLEGHDELDSVEAIGTKVIDETGIFRDLVGFHAQMLYDDLFHPLANVTHFSNLIYQRDPINPISVSS